MTRSTLLLLPALSQILAFPSPTLRPSPHLVTGIKRTPLLFRPIIPSSSVRVAKPPQEEEDTYLYDPEEFLEDVNFTATVMNGKVTPNRPADPLASMGNLTQKLASLAEQLDYQLSVARDDRGEMQQELEQTRADREKLQTVLTEIRRDKEVLATTLNETQTLHQQEHQNATLQIKTLQSSLNKHKKAFQTEQVKRKQLTQKVSAQEQQIQKTETSSRRLLFLLWKLLQRRIRNWIIFIFPIVFRMLESLMSFFFGGSNDTDNTAEEEQEEVGKSSQEATWSS